MNTSERAFQHFFGSLENQKDLADGLGGVLDSFKRSSTTLLHARKWEKFLPDVTKPLPACCVFDIVNTADALDDDVVRFTVLFAAYNPDVPTEVDFCRDWQGPTFGIPRKDTGSSRGIIYWNNALSNKGDYAAVAPQCFWETTFGSFLHTTRLAGDGSEWLQLLAALEEPRDLFAKQLKKRPVLIPSSDVSNPPVFVDLPATRGARIDHASLVSQWKTVSASAQEPMRHYTLYFNELDILCTYAFKIVHSVFSTVGVMGIAKDKPWPDATHSGLAKKVGGTVRGIAKKGGASEKSEQEAVKEWSDTTIEVLKKRKTSGKLAFVLMSGNEPALATVE
jgi:hypothetical protein